MKKVIGIFTCVILLLAFSFTTDVQTSDAASKPTKKELSSLQNMLRKIPLEYEKKIIYLEVNVTMDKNTISVTDYNIPHSILKLIDTQHGKNNIKPLKNWVNKAMPEIKKLAKKYNYSWSVVVINSCDTYEPQSFSEEEVLGNLGSCGYSFPLVNFYSNDKYVTILYNYNVGVK